MSTATIDQAATIETSYARLRALDTEGQRLALRELREFLTPSIRGCFHEHESAPRLSDLFALLRHLRLGDVQTPMLAHRALIRQIALDLRGRGFLETEWADLPRLVFNVLDAYGYDYQDGKWTTGLGART